MVLVYLMPPRCTRAAAGPLDPSLSGLHLTQHVLERYGLAKLMVQVRGSVCNGGRKRRAAMAPLCAAQNTSSTHAVLPL